MERLNSIILVGKVSSFPQDGAKRAESIASSLARRPLTVTADFTTISSGTVGFDQAFGGAKLVATRTVT